MNIFEEQITSRVLTDAESHTIAHWYEPTSLLVWPFDYAILELMREWTSSEIGGQWNYYYTSNGAWFMAPADVRVYDVKDATGSKIPMSAQAAGLAATMYLVHALASHYMDAGMEKRYREVSAHYAKLLLYSRKHEEVVAIWRVLD